MYSEVQAELRERKGTDIPMTHVIMTSDETDETWWDEVRAIGWVRLMRGGVGRRVVHEGMHRGRGDG